MDYIIKSDQIIVTVEDLGASLKSIKDIDNTEYIWQGDPEFWTSRAPHLFPYVGRFTEGKYTLNGKTYEMETHGFARFQTFNVEEHSGNRIVLSMTDNEETRKQYPYSFCFVLIYDVEGRNLRITYRVENMSKERMYFALGGHPGFNVPLEDGLAFEDYRLEFKNQSGACQIGMSETCFVNGQDWLYEFVKDCQIPLTHSLFDHDAIILKHMDRTLKLCSSKGEKSVTVTYPEMPYLGIWHIPKKPAPYVCIEPWTSLPSRDGVIEDFAQKSEMTVLAPGKVYENQWMISCE